MPAPALPTQLAPQSPSITEPSTTDIKGENDDLAILDAKIESLRSAKKVCRDEWQRLKQEADAAMDRYLEVEDELESLYGRRRKRLRVEQ